VLQFARLGELRCERMPRGYFLQDLTTAMHTCSISMHIQLLNSQWKTGSEARISGAKFWAHIECQCALFVEMLLLLMVAHGLIDV
jgi:hypothetical protein